MKIYDISQEAARKIAMELVEISRPLYGIHEKYAYTISDAARIYACHTATLRMRPWLLPNFGRSDFPGRLRWTAATWERWYMRSEADREHEWMGLDIRTKRRILAELETPTVRQRKGAAA